MNCANPMGDAICELDAVALVNWGRDRDIPLCGGCMSGVRREEREREPFWRVRWLEPFPRSRTQQTTRNPMEAA